MLPSFVSERVFYHVSCSSVALPTLGAARFWNRFRLWRGMRAGKIFGCGVQTRNKPWSVLSGSQVGGSGPQMFVNTLR